MKSSDFEFCIIKMDARKIIRNFEKQRGLGGIAIPYNVGVPNKI